MHNANFCYLAAYLMITDVNNVSEQFFFENIIEEEDDLYQYLHANFISTYIPTILNTYSENKI